MRGEIAAELREFAAEWPAGQHVDEPFDAFEYGFPMPGRQVLVGITIQPD